MRSELTNGPKTIAGREKIVKKRVRVKKAKKYRGELIWAIYDGRLEKVMRIIRSGIDIHKADDDGRTPLHWAAQEGHLKILQLRAAVNVKDIEGHSPPAHGYIQLVRYLLKIVLILKLSQIKNHSINNFELLDSIGNRKIAYSKRYKNSCRKLGWKCCSHLCKRIWK